MLYASHRHTGQMARQRYQVTISADTRNFNLRNAVNALGYTGQGAAEVTVVIAPGVIVGSTSTASHGFDTGSWPPGSSVTLTIGAGAYLVGRGGDGGNNGGGLGAGGAPGAPGGPAFVARLPTTIDSRGTIAGGGGGGSGGNDTVSGVDSPWGGGGAGDLPGYGGTLTTGGARHLDSEGGSGNPGNGGALGQPGQAGDRAGGAAGAAVDGNSFITWVAAGTRLGAINP